MKITSRKIAVVAIGGNSLIKDEKHKSVEDQYQAAKETTFHIADMIDFVGIDLYLIRRPLGGERTDGVRALKLEASLNDKGFLRCEN